MVDLEVGHVLSILLRFNNQGDKAKERHPCLIVAIHKELKAVEIVQLNSLKGKEHKAFNKYNKVILHTNPDEIVIDKDSFAQLSNRFTIAWFPGLVNYRRQPDKLSETKLESVIRAYRDYHRKNQIDENKIVHMDELEITELNAEKE